MTQHALTEVDVLLPRVIAIIESAVWTPHQQLRGVKIEAETALRDEAGFDSLDFQTVAIGLDEAFAIEVPDSEIESWRTPALVTASVVRLLLCKRQPSQPTEQQPC